MNSLSWLIYLADVVGTFLGITIVFFTVCGVAAGFTIIGSVIYSADPLENEKNERRILKKCAKTFSIIFGVAAILLIFTPTKKTIMLIAASEFGEEIAQSDKGENIGNKAYQALDKMLSEYLDTGKPE